MTIEDRLEPILQALLSTNEDITARCVSRKMSVAPTTITRVPARMALVERYREDQNRLRRIAASADKGSKENLIKKLAERDRQIEHLERKVQVLTASHRAMLLAIGEAGGLAAWHRFFEKYETIRSELQIMNAVPAAEIRQLCSQAEEESIG